ncbi:protein lifeguard 2-like [Athalia rosae]|uniref:protein lifeguard 2-like n=1 Tax=Athalia rosae TaxID=37344 RepID=UPI00203327E7|nr:protein lifeguard 2-like [Athalia rosae]
MKISFALFSENVPPYPPPPYAYSPQNNERRNQMQAVQMEYPPQLPPLYRGQKVRSGPFTITVTDEMVAERERENRELYRQWLAEQQVRNMSDEEREHEQYAREFRAAKIRRLFVRKVYCIITAELAFTAGFIAFVLYTPSVKQWVLRNWILAIGATFVYLITYVALTCVERVRRQAPCNCILMCLLTLAQSYGAAYASAHYNVELVFLALGMTALVTVVVTMVAMFAKFDFTSHSGMVLIISVAILVSVLVLALVGMFTRIKILWVICAALIVLLISVYLFYDTQLLMGGRGVELNPDEHIYAAVQIYVDVVFIFRYLLMCLGCMGDS